MATSNSPMDSENSSGVDLNTSRRAALAEIDNAPLGWYHLRACIVAGVGFFTDQYDIFTVSMLTTMLGIVYWPQHKGTIPTHSDTAIKVATSGGTVIGQVVFGILADIVGRKKMYGLELIIIIVATLGQALSAPGPALSIVGVMIFWRVVLGVGIGGDYPLSSTITSEFASTKWRGFMMAGVFSMQGLGQLVGGIVMLVVTVGFKVSLKTAKTVATCNNGVCDLAVDKMWRVLIGFGAVPACLALYYRLTIPETPRYTFDVARDVEKARSDVQAYMTGKREGVPTSEIKRLEVLSQADTLVTPKASFRDFVQYFSQWKNGKILLGTAGSWFCLDVAFYGLGLNSSTVLGAIGWTGGSDVYQILYKVAVGNIILVCAGALPGYWATMFTVDIIGRKPIQLMGFVILTLLFLVWGFDYKNISSNGMLGIYILAQFFFNFGPNTTTFLVPGECFPTRYRSTGHGLSAAAGKVGSIIAQAALAPLRVRGAAPGATGAAANPWQHNVMKIYAFFMLIGCFTTLLIPETKRKTLEELNNEDDVSGFVENNTPLKEEQRV